MPKISELPAATSLTSSDTIPVVQSGVTKSATVDKLPFNQSVTGSVARTSLSKQREVLSVLDFGAVGDWNGTTGTDSTAAFESAFAYLNLIGGGRLYVPRGGYRCTRQLVAKSTIDMYGDSSHDNPGIVAGVTYAFPTYFMGTVIMFDPGVAGILLYDCTDITIGEFLAGTNADKFKYNAARRSYFRDFTLLSLDNGAGASIGKHGFETRTVTYMDNVAVIGFRGDGFVIDATADAGTTSVYGNASCSAFKNCTARTNCGSGFHPHGRDVSVVLFDTCNSSVNGEWGFKDEGFLGNTYINCHAATNNTKLTADGTGVAGSFYASSLVAAHAYVGCYVEGGAGAEAWLAQSCTVLGGLLSGNVRRTDGAFAMMAGISYAAPYRYRNEQGTKDVGAALGIADTTMSMLAFSSIDDSVNFDYWKLKYENITPGWYGLEAANSPGLTVWQFPGSTAGARAVTSAFPSGIFLNATSGFGGTQILIDSGTAAAAPVASSVRGDFRFNRGTTTDGIIGWRMMVGGAGGQTMPIALPGDQAGVGTLADADATLTVMTSKVRQVARTPLTANRTLTLSATNVYAGAEFKVTRTAASTGAFTLSVGGLKALAVGQWCVVGYNGSAWELLEFGSL